MAFTRYLEHVVTLRKDCQFLRRDNGSVTVFTKPEMFMN